MRHKFVGIRPQFSLSHLFPCSNAISFFFFRYRYLNSSEAHIVVVAEDSGIPPRRASVPVVIKFGGEISARIQDPFSAALDSSLILLIFGVICLILFVVILTMTIYICKHKKKYNRSRLGSAFSNGNDPVGTKILTNYSLHPSNYANGIRKPHSGVGVDNPVFHRSDYTMNGSRPGSASSRRSSSETLSSDPSGNQLQPSQNGHHHHHHHHQPQALNPLNPQSGSHRYSKNSVIRSATVANVGRGSGALSGSVTPLSTSVIVPPPPPTPSIHSNGLPEPKYTSASNSNNNISANPMPSGSNSSSAYHNGAIPRSVGSVNSVHSSTHSVRSSTIDFHGSDASLQQALRDNIFNSSNRDLTRIQWPRNSIPRRVKKLSWEDEYELSREHGQDRDISTLTDPNVSVTPLDPNLLEPQIGKALYF